MFNIYFFENCDAPRELMYTSENPKSDIVVPSELNFRLDGGDNIDLTIYVDNPFYNRFRSMMNEIILEENEKIIYRGRILSAEENFESDGTLSKVMTFSGHETYLNDIVFSGEGLVFKDNKLSSLMETLLGLMNMKKKYSFEYIKNSFSDGIRSLYVEDAMTEAGEKSLKVAIDKFKEFHLFFFKSEHLYKDANKKIGLKTKMACVPYDLLLNNNITHSFIYGKQINAITKKAYYDKIYNYVIIGFGDKPFLHGVGSAMQNDLPSRTKHGDFEVAIEEKDIKYLSSANTMAKGVVDKYREPRFEVECEFIDTRLIEFKEPFSIAIGDVIELRRPSGEVIYKDIIAEISYEPLEPQKKQLVLGIEKLNLFKNDKI